MVERGWNIKVLGMSYKGEEHRLPFSVIPCDFYFMPQMIRNLLGQTIDPVDGIVTSMDIPLQQKLYEHVGAAVNVPWVCVFPVEGDPLTFSWASALSRFGERLVISKFGTEEVRKANLSAQYLPVGIDRSFWKPVENREEMRKTMGLEDKFVILTVADNQERKNLSSALEIFAEFIKVVPNSMYFLVTRINNPTGWILQDLITELKLGGHVQLLPQGISSDRLRNYYGISDVFLLTSKAEGLGMPVIEAMACRVPVVATDCTAIHENLEGGRGLLVDYMKPPLRDPWGNSRRYLISRDDALEKLLLIHSMSEENKNEILDKAQKYTDTLTWDRTTDVLEAALIDVRLKLQLSASPPGMLPSEAQQQDMETADES
jgi:glycosyltransferase involved in cell wall biosynthesis